MMIRSKAFRLALSGGVVTAAMFAASATAQEGDIWSATSGGTYKGHVKGVEQQHPKRLATHMAMTTSRMDCNHTWKNGAIENLTTGVRITGLSGYYWVRLPENLKAKKGHRILVVATINCVGPDPRPERRITVP
jgi:hypothetical protein